MATSRRLAVLTVAAAVLLAGCVAAPAPTPAPPAPGPPTQPSTTPSVRASTSVKTTLAINPVDYGGVRVVVATFSEPVVGGVVDLEQRTGSGWEVVGSGTQDSSGRVEFHVPYSKTDYRAVARETADGLHPAVTTRTMNQSDQWKLDFSEEFSGRSLATKYWSPRQSGEYVGSRLCSAPYPTNLKIKDGSLVETVRASSAERTRQVERSAAARLGVSVTEGCPYGVWDAAMVSTEGNYAFRYGLAAVRAKFPATTGVHGSVWLQATKVGGVEIDFIETFGPEFGIQHKLHFTKNGEVESTGGYVRSLPEVKTDAWWDEYHVFSVDWSAKEYVFRVDGVETFRTRKGVSKGDEYLILSLLASDWELERIDPAEMPATMAVDWVRVWKQK